MTSTQIVPAESESGVVDDPMPELSNAIRLNNRRREPFPLVLWGGAYWPAECILDWRVDHNGGMSSREPRPWGLIRFYTFCHLGDEWVRAEHIHTSLIALFRDDVRDKDDWDQVDQYYRFRLKQHRRERRERAIEEIRARRPREERTVTQEVVLGEEEEEKENNENNENNDDVKNDE